GHEARAGYAGLGKFLARTLSEDQIGTRAQVSKTFMAMNNCVDQLCPKCGLCCNGALFADVRLQKNDDSRRLTELGLSVKSKADRPVFPQPCSCFVGTLCRIYAERPGHCRAFECGLLKR